MVSHSMGWALVQNSQCSTVDCYNTVANLQCVSGIPGKLVKTQAAGPHPRVSDSVGKGCDPRICISNKFPSDVNATDSLNHWATHTQLSLPEQIDAQDSYWPIVASLLLYEQNDGLELPHWSKFETT